MKKIGFIIFFIAAGVHGYTQLEIRPLVGLNFGSVQESPDGVTTSAKVGYQFGGNLMIGERFHYYPGITYNKQVIEYLDDASDVSVDQTVAGVEIPLCVGFKLIQSENEDLFNIRLYTGPTMLFHTTTEYSESFLDDEVDWKDMSWGARLGAGIDLSFLFVDLSYDFGLSDIHDVSEALENFKDKRHNTFLISAGLKLTLGG